MAIFRTVFKGHLPNGDIWTTSLGSASENGITSVALVSNSFMQQWATFIREYHTVNFGFDEYTVYQIDPVTGKANDARTGGTPWQGNGDGTSIPNQCSMVASLRTGLPGPSMRGRAYWPWTTNTGLQSDGHFTSTLTGEFATNFASALTTSQAAASTHRWAVLHRGGVLGLTSTAITQVRCANLPRTQRRRTNAADVVYQSGTVL